MHVVYAVLALVFAAAFYVAFSLLAGVEVRKERSPIQARLEELHSTRVALQTQMLLNDSSMKETGAAVESPLKVIAQLRSMMGKTEARLAKRGLNKRIEHRLRQAGLRLRASEFLALRAVSGMLAGIIGFAVTRHVLGLLAGALAGSWLPELHVERTLQKRLRQFGAQLPEALVVIANSLRSGYSFLQAVDVASNELADPIAAEFRQLVKETQVDIPLEDALANLLSRVPSQELQLVVTAVLIQRQAGGNLANLLDQVSDTLRQRIRFQGEVKAMTAQGRMSGWIVAALPVALGMFMYVVNPEYIGLLFQEPLGKAMLGASAVLEVIGMVIIRRMVQIEL